MKHKHVFFPLLLFFFSILVVLTIGNVSEFLIPPAHAEPGFATGQPGAVPMAGVVCAIESQQLFPLASNAVTVDELFHVIPK